jgi:hypothetical protein
MILRWVWNGAVYVFGSIVYLGLKFEMVLPWVDLKTNVVVIENSTSRDINWSVNCSPTIRFCTLPINFWAGGSVTRNPPLHYHGYPLQFP